LTDRGRGELENDSNVSFFANLFGLCQLLCQPSDTWHATVALIKFSSSSLPTKFNPEKKPQSKKIDRVRFGI
jgi:hypothetical protein